MIIIKIVLFAFIVVFLAAIIGVQIWFSIETINGLIKFLK